MIDHIVLFKLKPDADPAAIKTMCQALENLKHKIPQLIEIRAGLNFSERNLGYGVMLVSRFQSKKDLEIYSDHPEHRKVVSENVSPIRESVVVGDLEYQAG